MLTDWQAASVLLWPSFGDPKWGAQNSGPHPGDGNSVDQARNTKVLVIDDETMIAETVVEILKHEGFEAIAVATGLSAIELAKQWAPDIVLSDVIMPGLNGIETGIKIRELIPDCKVILFSGQAATVNLLEDARERGHYFEILAKPIRPEHLVKIIRGLSGNLS